MSEVETGIIANSLLSRQREDYYSPGHVSKPAKLAELYLVCNSLRHHRKNEWNPIVNIMRSVIGATHTQHDPEDLPDAILVSSEGSYRPQYSGFSPGEYALLVPEKHRALQKKYFHTLGFYDDVDTLGFYDNVEPVHVIGKKTPSGEWYFVRVQHHGQKAAGGERNSWDELLQAPLASEDLALQLLRNLGTSPLHHNSLDISVIGEESLGRLLPVMSMLLKSDVVSVYNNKLFRTKRGSDFVQAGETDIKMLEPRRGRTSYVGAAITFLVGALAGFGLTSSVEDAWSRTKAKFKRGEKDNYFDDERVEKTPVLRERNAREESSNLNYQAFLRDIPELEEKYDSCVVAYYGGKRIAVQENIHALLKEIPVEYRGDRLFIEYLPQRTITIRPPLRLLASS
jgi:hypothetical protein